jgi:hypothetical protein
MTRVGSQHHRKKNSIDGYNGITFSFNNYTVSISQWPWGSKVCVCGRSLAGPAGSNHAEDMDVSLVSVVCCQAEVSATGWSLVQRSPTECGVSECDSEASIIRRPCPTRGLRAIKKLPHEITAFFKISYLDKIRNVTT